MYFKLQIMKKCHLVYLVSFLHFVFFKAGTVFPDECKIKLSSDEAHTCLAALAEFYVICDSKNPSKKIISRYLDLKLSSHEVMYIFTFFSINDNNDRYLYVT